MQTIFYVVSSWELLLKGLRKCLHFVFLHCVVDYCLRYAAVLKRVFPINLM
jgi:hypothetical protein